MTLPIEARQQDSAAAKPIRKRLAGRRVAMVTFSNYPFDPRPRRSIDALVGEGATVDLICLGNENEPRREKLAGINVLRVPLKHPRRGKLEYGFRYGAFILASATVFAWRSISRHYDLVYVHNMPDILVMSSLVPKLLGAKVVLDLHDPMPELMMTIFRVPESNSSVRLMKRLEKWSIARTDLAITVNIACKRIFGARSCKEDKIGVVMNAPDGDIFPFRAAQARAAERGRSKPFVIMYHGSIVERNGLDLAVEALAQIREKIPSAELRIYGRSTPFLEQVMAMAKEKGLEKSVRYLGAKQLEELVSEIEDCDVGVIPNQKNSFTDINTPTRIFEYLALGKPVIAPRTLGIEDYFTPESLLFFDSGDAQGLAKKFEYVFNHPAEVFETAKNGQQIYMGHTWEMERETLIDRVAGILPAR